MITDNYVMSEETAVQSRKAKQQNRIRKILYGIANHSGLFALASMFIFPFYLVIVVSLMSRDQALLRSLWPDPLNFANYTEVFTTVPFLKWTWNTFVIASLSVVGAVIANVPPAYALSHLHWKGRQTVFIFILGTMMLPGQVTMIPIYVTFAKFGWIPSNLPLIVPNFFAGAFSIFLLRQFFVSIPSELTDAGRVDGCSEWQLMMRIIVPLAKPAIYAIAIFTFIGQWNDFFGAKIYLSADPELWTLGIGLTQFGNEHATNMNTTMAASVLFMLPLIIVFFFAQKVFVEGVTLTGVKG
jgi:multiple sugar transport system permease protein